MAYPTIATPSPSYHRPAGFKGVYIRPSGELYQTLGGIAEGELKFGDIRVSDQQGKNKTYCVEFTAKAKMLQASLTAIELLDQIASGANAWLFKMSDAAAIPSAAAVTEGWVLVSAAQVGCKPTLVMSGTTGSNAYIMLEWKGSLLLSEYAAAVKASIDDGDFEATGGTGTLKALGTYTAALDGGAPTVTQIVPCGISSVTIAEAGGAAQTLGSTKNAKIEFTYFSDDDDLGRYLPHAVGVDISYEWMQTDAANLINLGGMTDTEVDLVITMRSGVVITLSNKLGISLEYESVGNFDKKRVVRHVHQGHVLMSDIDGIFS